MAHDSQVQVGSRMASVLNLAISGVYGCSCFEGVQLYPFQLGETDTAPSFLQTINGSTVFGIHYSCVAFWEFSMFANPCFVAASWDDDLSSKTSAELKSLLMKWSLDTVDRQKLCHHLGCIKLGIFTIHYQHPWKCFPANSNFSAPTVWFLHRKLLAGGSKRSTTFIRC